MAAGHSIRASGIQVQIPIYDAAHQSLRNRLVAVGTGGRIATDKARVPLVLALDGVDIEVKEGERVALLGHNGSGKSTLLRVMAGVYHPTAGRVVTEGRVVSIFDTNFGMDPDATGRENIVLRGLFLGMSLSQIESQVDGIINFSDLGDFIDLPMRTYSLGMATRLAFAVSTSMQPDIFILDEGFNTGDAAFREKARARLNQFVDSAGILVMASHDLDMVRRLCSRGVVLERGRIVADGPLDDSIKYYLAR